MQQCACGGSCQEDPTQGGLTRRGVLAGTALAAAGMALAGCADTVDSATPASTEPGESASPQPSGDGSATSGPTSAPLVGVNDFPVGGGAIVDSAAGTLVITHPDDDVFLAFDARCPHAGCIVKEVTENTVLCACHGSTFDGSTGDRLEGPAPSGLEGVAVRVEGGSVYLV